MSSRAYALCCFIALGQLCGCASADPFHLESPLTRTAPLPEPSAPEHSPGEELRLARLSDTTLQNGMRARVVERPLAGLVSLLYVNRRARRVTDYMPVFLGDALLAGAYGRDGRLIYPLAVDEEVPRVSTGSSGTRIALRCASESLPEAMALLASLVQRPAFEPHAMQNVRLQTLLGLRGVRAVNTDWQLAMRHEGKSFPLDLDAVAARIRSIDWDTLTRAHRDFFWPDDSELIVVGDVNAERAHALVAQEFSGWQKLVQPAASVSTEAPRAQSETASVPARQRPQIIVEEEDYYPRITLVQRAPAVESEDAVAFELLADILVEHGEIGLLRSLRYDRPHAYGVRARTLGVPARGRYLVIETAVAAQTAAQDLDQMLTALRSLKAMPVDAGSLSAAKARLVGRVAGALASTGGAAQYLSDVYLQQALPLETLRTRLSSITPQDVHQLAQRYLEPEQATVRVSGKLSGGLDAFKRSGDVFRE